MHTRFVVYVAGVLVVVAVVGVVTWRVLSGTTTYQQALDTLPDSTLRTTYVDWQVVREQAKGTSLGAGSSSAEVDEFLGRAYDLDLTSGSGVSDSTSVLAQRFGFSPLHARWEALGQSRQGQVDVMKLDDEVDMPGIERALRRLGYKPPSSGAGKGGTWLGGPDLVSTISGDLTPIEQYVVVLPDDKLVLMSDNQDYATLAAKVASGSGDSLADDEGVSSLAAAADTPVAAVQWTSTFACEDLTMGSADESDQQAGDDLVAKAGKISPLDGLVMAQQADRALVVGMHFETSQQASANLQTRVDLASGASPGQGGSFDGRFKVTSGKAAGKDVVLDLKPRTKQALLSDISTGPVLFATC